MKQSRIVFFGTEDFSLPILERFIEEGWNVVAVVTKPDAPAGRGQTIKKPAVKPVAQTAKIKVFQPLKVKDIKDELIAQSPSCGILVAYGKILPREIIDIFPEGIINVHPSLLPKYRGSSPTEAAILNNDDETGISLMQLTTGMDEGPLYAQKIIKIPPGADRLSLSSHLAGVGADFLLEKLPQILDGSLKPQPQDDSQATYSSLLKKEDGLVDWNKPAEQIEREVRAFAGWPKSRAKIKSHEIIITKARVVQDENDGALVMKCSRGYLEIQELLAPSGRTVSGNDFLRGYSREAAS